MGCEGATYDASRGRLSVITKDFHHAVVGDLTLTYKRMDLAATLGRCS